MMGPWLVFAALLNGATLALFQGSPLGRDFGVFVEAAGVSMLGLVPSIAKAWRASDCMQVGAKSAWALRHCHLSCCQSVVLMVLGLLVFVLTHKASMSEFTLLCKLLRLQRHPTGHQFVGVLCSSSAA